MAGETRVGPWPEGEAGSEEDMTRGSMRPLPERLLLVFAVVFPEASEGEAIGEAIGDDVLAFLAVVPDVDLTDEDVGIHSQRAMRVASVGRRL